MTKRIAIIAPHFSEYSERLASGLADQAPTLLILNTLNRSKEVADHLAGRAQVNAIPMDRRVHQLASLLFCTLRLLLFRPDVVIVQEGVRLYLKPLFRLLQCFTRVALIVHDPLPHSGSDSALAKVHIPFRRWLREHADALIVHGEACRREMALLGFDPNKIITINHGVLMAPGCRKRMVSKPRRVLMFGRMEAYKGVEILLEAVELLNRRGVSLHLVVAGAGPEQARLAARMTALGNVEAIDRYLTPEELQYEIGRSSFVVAPYLDATQSGVLASTFANGRPAVASDVGGLGDVVKHDFNGLLVPPRDPEALAGAMAALLEDPVRAARLAGGAQAFARDELNWNRIAERLLGSLDPVVNQRRKRVRVTATILAFLGTFTLTHPTQSWPKSPTRFSAPDCGRTPIGRGNSGDPPTVDMYGTSEIEPAGALRPNGRPMSWAVHPRIARGNNPQKGWTHMVPWGQVYISTIGNSSRNTRVHVRSLRLFVRPKATGRWCRLAYTLTPSGAFYRADFASDVHVRGDQRQESEGGLSFRPTPGQAFHFYTVKRVLIPAQGLTGVYADFEARLIKDDPHGPDDRSQASLVASAGADYWMSDVVPSGKVLTYNEDAGIGRFRRVSNVWNTYSMNTAAPNARRSMSIVRPE